MNSTVEGRRMAMAKRHPAWIETTLDAYFDLAVRDFADAPLVLTDTETGVNP